MSILMGNGDGTFQAPIFYPAGSYPSSIVAGDLTGNGVIDLAVANAGSDNVTVLLGNGHGGFQALLPISLGDQAHYPVAITAGDFNGNGVLDLAVVDQSTDGVSILEGNGQGDSWRCPRSRSETTGSISTARSWRATSRATGTSTWRSRAPPPMHRTTCRSCWVRATARSLSSRRSPWERRLLPCQSPPETFSAAARLTWRSPIPAPIRFPCSKVTARAGSRSCRRSSSEARSIRPSSRRATSLATAAPTWPSRRINPPTPS